MISNRIRFVSGWIQYIVATDCSATVFSSNSIRYWSFTTTEDKFVFYFFQFSLIQWVAFFNANTSGRSYIRSITCLYLRTIDGWYRCFLSVVFPSDTIPASKLLLKCRNSTVVCRPWGFVACAVEIQHIKTDKKKFVLCMTLSFKYRLKRYVRWNQYWIYRNT